MQLKSSLILALLIITLPHFISPVFGKTEAHNFTLTDIEGNEFSLSNQLGKVVIINFFAIDCYYCRLEMPILKALHDE